MNEQSPVSELPFTCACGEAVTGRFCPACGERRFDRADMTVKHFVSDVLLRELVDYDGRVWRTLRLLLFKPGTLTAEDRAGRGRLSIKPVRLFVFAVLVYAVATQGGFRAANSLRMNVRGQEINLTISMAPVATAPGVSVEETLTRLDPTGTLNAFAARRPELKEERGRGDFHERLGQLNQPLSFTNVLLLALLLFGMFFRRYPLDVQHGVFAMHYMAFVLLTTAIAAEPVLGLMRSGYLITGLLLGFGVSVGQLAYLATAVRRFYLAHDRRVLVPVLTSIAAGLLLFFANGIVMTAIQALGAGLALLTV